MGRGGLAGSRLVRCRFDRARLRAMLKGESQSDEVVMPRLSPVRAARAFAGVRIGAVPIAAMSLAALLLATPDAPAQQKMREIAGEAVYRERRALSEDAQLVVELTGMDGTFAAESRIMLDGRQVPLPFAIQAAEGRDYRLRGAIVEAGAVVFLSEVLAVPAGVGDLALGPVLFRMHRPMGFATLLRCGDVGVELGFVGEGARLRVAGRFVELVPEPAASGARYVSPEDPGTFAWTRGNSALVSIDGVELPECGLAVAPDLLPLRAQGNEPAWSLELAEGRMLFIARLGAMRIEAALPEPEVTREGLRLVLPEPVEIELRDALCRDSMSGMVYPLGVEVTVEDERFVGCGGTPRSLLTGDGWRVTALEGVGEIEAGAELDLRFGEDGLASGRAGCNRFTGGYVLTGEGLRMQRLAATRMACPDALMALETAMLGALAQVDGFDLDEAGGLVLLASGRPVLRAVRAE